VELPSSQSISFSIQQHQAKSIQLGVHYQHPTKELLREQTWLNQTRLMAEIEASQKTMKEHAQANEELCKANEELRALSWTTSHPGTFPKHVIKR